LRYLPEGLSGKLIFWLLFSGLSHAIAIAWPRHEQFNKMAELLSDQSTISATVKLATQPLSLRTVKKPHRTAVTAPTVNTSNHPIDYPSDEASDFPEVLDTTSLRGADYYEVSELTAKPQILDEPIFDLWDIASISESGRAILALRIDAQGKVIDASVDFSDLPEVFTQSAINAFRSLRFVPGELKGEKVNSTLRIEIRYGEIEGKVP
jgi:TonB family protein